MLVGSFLKTLSYMQENKTKKNFFVFLSAYKQAFSWYYIVLQRPSMKGIKLRAPNLSSHQM